MNRLHETANKLSSLGLLETRSHPEMVGDMSRVTYQKFLLRVSSQGQDLYLHKYVLVLILRAVTDAAAAADDNAGHHSTTTRATYCQ